MVVRMTNLISAALRPRAGRCLPARCTNGMRPSDAAVPAIRRSGPRFPDRQAGFAAGAVGRARIRSGGRGAVVVRPSVGRSVTRTLPGWRRSRSGAHAHRRPVPVFECGRSRRRPAARTRSQQGGRGRAWGRMSRASGNSSCQRGARPDRLWPQLVTVGFNADLPLLLREQEPAAERSAEPFVATGGVEVAAEGRQIDRQHRDRMRTINDGRDSGLPCAAADLRDGEDDGGLRGNVADDNDACPLRHAFEQRFGQFVVIVPSRRGGRRALSWHSTRCSAVPKACGRRRTRDS